MRGRDEIAKWRKGTKDKRLYLLPDLFCLGTEYLTILSSGERGRDVDAYFRRRISFSTLVLVIALFTNFFTIFPVFICIRFPSPHFLVQEYFFP